MCDQLLLDATSHDHSPFALLLAKFKSVYDRHTVVFCGRIREKAVHPDGMSTGYSKI